MSCERKTSDSRFCRCLFFSVNALARKVSKLAEDSWKEAPMSASLSYVQMIVNEAPGISAGDLAQELQLAPSTMTRFLEKLEKEGYLIRKQEGKQVLVFSTEKGLAIQDVLRTCLVKFYQNYSQILGKEDSALLVGLMNTMADKL
jgi:DNA-binding MarR family transcriptional regulator